ncbi:transcriptional regulator with XRE-family HTH domain [Altererythrobacter atlanticus]|nr:transcriptional regulator with XRE-family HTH domain [Croceibacterium atlanticum]
MSQSELASRLGRPQQFVSRYELSKRRLDIIEYVDVAQNLDLDPPAELGKIL